MELIDKANVLADFFDIFSNDPSGIPSHTSDLFVEWDLAWFYAAGLAYGDILTLSSSGENLILRLWDAVLAHYNIADVEYTNLAELASAAGILDPSIFHQYYTVLDGDELKADA